MKTRVKWRRALVNPRTHVEAQDATITRLRVDGLVCSTICAVRTKDALSALPGVTAVTVDFEAGVATIEGPAHDPSTYDRAVTGAVAGKPVRRLIEHLATRWHSFSRRPLPPSPEP
jgi:hypothetical protein